jgi:serine/threonine-protein kinase
MGVAGLSRSTEHERMSSNAALLVGWLSTTFPDLQNILPLSQGGQKQVFSAQHVTEGEVVLKLMHYTADIERTQREVLAVNQVQSTRIPKIFADGTITTPQGDCFWFREQRIVGPTVRERMGQGAFSTPELLRLGLHVTETLVAAEAAGIVHRDIKPENLIIDGAGDVWLIDFGLARHLGLESLTATALMFGNLTWGYAPLEQCRNIKQEIDGRADLFALGVTLYECATGTNPFRAGARDVLEVLTRIEAGSIPRLQLSFGSASDFADFVASLTQKNRVHRPRNTVEALQWIKDICDREGVE